jgi:hypothetical protein
MSDPSAEKKVQDAAFVLVGEFMFHWSYIESKITEGIQSLLTLETPELRPSRRIRQARARRRSTQARREVRGGIQ